MAAGQPKPSPVVNVHRESSMAKYLISFPSAAMVVPDGDMAAVSHDSHAVIAQAKAAGVYVFGGGIDERVPPVRISADGAVAPAVTRGRRRSMAVSRCSNCRRGKTPSCGRRALPRPAAATRNCACSGSIRRPEPVWAAPSAGKPAIDTTPR